MRKTYIVKYERYLNNIIKTGQYKKNKDFVIYSLNNNLKFSRFGISIGKKLGNAVYRNKYKRKIRAIIDNNKKNWPNNKDYIIILRKSAKDKNYRELEESLVSLY